MDVEATQIFVANWISRFYAERGIIGWPEPDELTTEIVRWMDDETLNDLVVALCELLKDKRATEGHELAHALLTAVENDTRIYYGYIKRRPNRKAEQFAAIA